MLKAYRATKARREGGFSLVEVLLSGSIFALLVVFLIGALIYGRESTTVAGGQARASLIADEGMEAVRSIRDSGWTSLADGTYGLAVTGGKWVFSGSSDVVDGFTRQVVVSTVDTKTKLVTVTVTWTKTVQRSGTLTMTGRLTKWIPPAGWSGPSRESGLDLTGTNDGTKVAISGNYAYVVRNGGTNFMVIDITNTASPSVVGSLTLGGVPTNIFVSGNYAYVSSTSDSQELQIVNITTPSSPSLTGSYNADDAYNANGIFVSGTTAYLTRDPCSGIVSCSADWFITINVSNPASPTKLGAIQSGGLLLGLLGGDQPLNEVVVLGSYAYVGTGDSDAELLVVNVSNASSPSATTTYNATGTTTGVSVTGFNSVVLLGTGSGNMHLINVTTPSSPATLSTFAAATQVNDIVVGNSNNYAFLVASTGTKEFQVVDISTTTSPSLLGIYNAAGTLNGVSYSATKDRAAVVGTEDTDEFKILQPL